MTIFISHISIAVYNEIGITVHCYNYHCIYISYIAPVYENIQAIDINVNVYKSLNIEV